MSAGSEMLGFAILMTVIGFGGMAHGFWRVHRARIKRYRHVRPLERASHHAQIALGVALMLIGAAMAAITLANPFAEF